MKKVGIITFHRSHNCGSIMQAYALQKVLQTRYGIAPEFIDFSSPGQQKLYSVFSGDKSVKGTLRNVGRAFIYNRLKKNQASYDRYIKKHLRLSSRVFTTNKELQEAHFAYDAYIAGSDQVWNIMIDDYDPAYFLNFVEKKKPKISYAASFGARRVSSNTNHPEAIRDMIRDFDHISVREPNGQKWLAEDFAIKSTVVLDPTLLIDGGDYCDGEESPTEHIKKDYIFIYAVSVSRKFEQRIQQLAREEGLKIVIWQPDTWLKMKGAAKGYILPKDENPGKYLWYIRHAKYVFTASFHGVIFCAQYRKNFWILYNKGMNYDKDDRILSLVDSLALSDRLLPEDDTEKDLRSAVDYTAYEKNLAKRRQQSFAFLDKAVKNI
jgi:hypothetical protein